MKIVILLLCILNLSSYNYNEIVNHRGDNLAQITGTEPIREGYNFKYKYVINNITYEGRSSMIVDEKNVIHFINKHFPIVYSKRHPDVSIILIMPENFSQWGLTFPDSLNWVRKYMYY